MQCHSLQLASECLSKTSPTYAKLSEDLQKARLTYSMNIGAVHVNVFPSNTPWEMFHEQSRHCISYVGHLVGIN